LEGFLGISRLEAKGLILREWGAPSEVHVISGAMDERLVLPGVETADRRAVPASLPRPEIEGGRLAYVSWPYLVLCDSIQDPPRAVRLPAKFQDGRPSDDVLSDVGYVQNLSLTKGGALVNLFLGNGDGRELYVDGRTGALRTLPGVKEAIGRPDRTEVMAQVSGREFQVRQAPESERPTRTIRTAVDVRMWDYSFEYRLLTTMEDGGDRLSVYGVDGRRLWSRRLPPLNLKTSLHFQDDGIWVTAEQPELGIRLLEFGLDGRYRGCVNVEMCVVQRTYRITQQDDQILRHVAGVRAVKAQTKPNIGYRNEADRGRQAALSYAGVSHDGIARPTGRSSASALSCTHFPLRSYR
jgi:hypothetical protein